MFEKFLENVILNNFGDYIENFDKNNISAGIWSGRVILDGVLIKSSAINELKLPFKFIYGRIGKLDFTVDWKSNFTQPTMLIIENLHIIVSMLKQEEWEYIDYISYHAKMQSLNYFASTTMLKIQEALSKKKNEKSQGYLERVFIKVIDNLQVTIKNIHFRIEDTTMSPNYCLGITLQEMLMVNTNDKWEQVFTDRSIKENKNVNIFKLLEITNFGIYLKLNETKLISIANKDSIEKEMEIVFPTGTSCAKDLDYLIQPMCLLAKMMQKNNNNSEGLEVPRFTLWINLEKFNIDIQKEQFNCIIRILNLCSSYQRFQFNYYETRRYNFLKPRYKIKDNVNKYNYFKSKEIRNPNAVIWWKFAIRTVIKRQKFIRGK